MTMKSISLNNIISTTQNSRRSSLLGIIKDSKRLKPAGIVQQSKHIAQTDHFYMNKVPKNIEAYNPSNVRIILK